MPCEIGSAELAVQLTIVMPTQGESHRLHRAINRWRVFFDAVVKRGFRYEVPDAQIEKEIAKRRVVT